MQEFEELRIADNRLRRRLWVVLWAAAIASYAAFTWAMLGPAWSHDAAPAVSYPMICCSNRDCRPTAEGEVKQTPRGYVLASTGEVVPYSDRRIKPFQADGKIHVCQQAGNFDSGRILCLLVPPPSF